MVDADPIMAAPLDRDDVRWWPRCVKRLGPKWVTLDEELSKGATTDTTDAFPFPWLDMSVVLPKTESGAPEVGVVALLRRFVVVDVAPDEEEVVVAL